GKTALTGPQRSNDEFTGFTIGGPLMKNRLFIFGGFDEELVGQSANYQTTGLTPTPQGLAQLQGCFPSSNTIAALAKFGPYGISSGSPTPFVRPSPTNPNALPSLVTVGSCAKVTFTVVSRTLPQPFPGNA